MVEKLIIAKNVKETVSLMKEGFQPLAGGTEVNRLNSTVKGKNFVYIGKIADLKTIEKSILEGVSGSYIKIGAVCTFQDAIENDLVPGYLKEACRFMSSRVRRNMATLCGNIAVRRDDSYLIPALLAADAKLFVYSMFGRKSVISLSDYIFKKEKYGSYFVAALLVNTETGAVSQKRYANTASSHGYITMAAAKKGDMCQVGLCVKNSGFYVFDGSKTPDVVLKDDIFGSRAYKKYLIDVTREDLVSSVQGDSGCCCDGSEKGKASEKKSGGAK